MIVLINISFPGVDITWEVKEQDRIIFMFVYVYV